MKPQPIVITGLGILSPLGIGAAETVAALREGASALFPATRYAPPDGVNPLVGQVPDFTLADFLNTPKAYLDRNSELFLAACGMALQAAGVDPKSMPAGRAGVLAGTAWGGLDSMSAFFADYVRKGPRLVKPLLFPHTYANTAISLAAMEWSLTGTHLNYVTGRIASAQAIAEAASQLRAGQADLLLAGGCEALGLPLHQALASQGVLAPADDAAAPHPFDTRRNGLILAEAGAVLVLETEAHARSRGALPLAQLLGSGCGSDVATALTAALAEAGVAATDLAAVCASANGCAAVDDCEAAALRQLVADARIPVTAPASLCGDTLGACGAVQAVLGTLMLMHGVLPPVAGLTTPIRPELQFVTTQTMPLRPGPLALLTTDPSGACVALVLQRA
jgi:3-oxoacyl-[acyl-carrier-protein] synthase II